MFSFSFSQQIFALKGDMSWPLGQSWSGQCQAGHRVLGTGGTNLTWDPNPTWWAS